MTLTQHINPKYQGIEQGPIRPPSEAYSLLIRVTRNCPSNRSTFCPSYKQLYSQEKLFAHQMQSMNKTIDEITDELMQRFI